MSEPLSSRKIDIVLLVDPPTTHIHNTSLFLTRNKYNAIALDAKKYTRYQAALPILGEISDRLLDYLDLYFDLYPERSHPQRILDLSCRSGLLTQRLSCKFPNSQIISFDHCDKLLTHIASGHNIIPISGLLTEAPFQENYFDLIISHAQTDYALESKSILSQLYALLKPKGLLLASTFGSQTLQDLQKHWTQIRPGYQYIPTWPAVSTIGDTLKSLLFTNPVISQEILKIQYSTLNQALAELKILNCHWNHPKRFLGLSSMHQVQAFLNQIPPKIKNPLLFEFDLELIYVSAIK